MKLHFGHWFRTWIFNILRLLLLTNLADAISCPDAKNLKWVTPASNKQDGYIRFLAGEWWEIDCRMNNNKVNVTLWEQHLYANSAHKPIFVDGTHIILKEKNIFRIPKLVRFDSARYYCKACQMTKYVGGITVKKGVPFAELEVRKTPDNNISAYDSKVTLECSVRGSYNDYEIEWFRVSSTGKMKPLASIDNSTRSIKKIQRKVVILPNVIQKDEGTYLCRIRRYYVQYSADKTIKITLEEVSKPTILHFPDQSNIVVAESQNISFKYNVSGTPFPDITWYRSRDGKEEPVAWFSVKKNISQSKIPGVTRNYFTVGSFVYSKDNNVSYVCRASNPFGNSSRSFSVVIKVKPSLTTMRSDVVIYKPNMVLECTLSKNGHYGNVTFTWQLCKSKNDRVPATARTCTEQNTWESLDGQEGRFGKFKKDVSESSFRTFRKVKKDVSESSLRIGQQTSGMVIYRCSARNAIGKDEFSWKVVIPAEHRHTKCSQVQESSTGSKGNNDDKQVAIWQFTTICMGGFVLLALISFCRGRQAQKKFKLVFSKQDIVTKV